MSAYIKNLIDYNGDIVYPQTKVEAIFNADGKPLADILSNLISEEYINNLIDAKLGVIENGSY